MSMNLVAQQTYFQQEVNYKMNVVLNDKDHSLKAEQEIQYINNSNTSLDFIYFHLWPNAYKDHSTALAKQLLDLKRTEFYYSKPEDRGYIDSLDFKVNGSPVKVEFDPQNKDICKILLNVPLRSLDTIKITTPFYVKIPSARFSRMGHSGQAYYITQWYPKPAVYDKDGWHPMPYLDQGEFYSEFGSFDVSITLPQNYILAATGDRIDADAEEDFLNQKVIKTLEKIDRGLYEGDMSFPPSSPKNKTVRFKQYRVHDFAWFADKRFNVLHDQIKLPNTEKIVDTWTFFTNKNFRLWKDALDYVNESTLFYSYMVGDYPYNNISAVDGVLMAGGGMEYPNITVIGDVGDPLTLDVTITHEVGHNWFYGILGSNEREFPALDEGLNSYYEMTYVKAKYPERKLGELVGVDSTNRLLGLNRYEYWREKEISYMMSARSNIHQPLNTPAAELSSYNYGAIIYSKMAVVLDYLHDYMGDDAFNKAMQFYYENYKFKHPKPSDLLQTLQYFSGVDLGWLNKHLFSTNDKIDYSIRKVKRNDDGSYLIKVKNKAGTAVPFNVYGYKNGKVVGMAWYNGSDSTRRVDFPPSDIDVFKIDGLDLMPDVNRRNNSMRTHGLFKHAKPLQFNFITKLPDPSKNQVNYFPIAGYNLYNGFMLGGVLHNYSIYEKKVEFSLAPMYAFQSKTPVGFAEINLNLFPRSVFRKVTIGANAKSFSKAIYQTVNFAGSTSDYYINYLRISPNMQFELQQKDRTKSVKQTISVTHHLLFNEQLNYSMSQFAQESYYYKDHSLNQLLALNFTYKNSRIIHPFSFQMNLHYDNFMAKMFGEYKQKITVSRKKDMEIRVFAGTFLQGNDQQKGAYRFRMSGFNGYHDYLYETNYLGRNEFDGLSFGQFTENDGAFKVWTPLGQSSTYLISMNIKSPQIWKLPIRVFADIGTADVSSMNKETVLWAAGVNLNIVKDYIDVYLPLLYSNDIKETLTLNNKSFLNTVRFTFNIHQVKPREMVMNNLF